MADIFLISGLSPRLGVPNWRWKVRSNHSRLSQSSMVFVCLISRVDLIHYEFSPVPYISFCIWIRGMNRCLLLHCPSFIFFLPSITSTLVYQSNIAKCNLGELYISNDIKLISVWYTAGEQDHICALVTHQGRGS